MWKEGLGAVREENKIEEFYKSSMVGKIANSGYAD